MTEDEKLFYAAGAIIISVACGIQFGPFVGWVGFGTFLIMGPFVNICCERWKKSEH